MYLGVDPGWRNMAVAVIRKDMSLAYSGTLDLKSEGSFEKARERVVSALEPFIGVIEYAVVERYVPYGNGTPSSDAEMITMMGGAMAWYLATEEIPFTLERAIAWKSAVCKTLFKEAGFKNPSDRFDDKYSVSAAGTITGTRLKSIHEADAVCMAYLASKIHKAKAK